MRMRAQQVPQPRQYTQPTRTIMAVDMLVLVIVTAAVAMAASGALRLAHA